MLLGCLCADLDSAWQLSQVLSRSGVKVNQRHLHSLNGVVAADLAPFEIVILDIVQGQNDAALESTFEQLHTAWRWFQSHHVKRYLLHYRPDQPGALADQLGHIANCLLKLVADKGPDWTIYCGAPLPPDSLNTTSASDTSACQHAIKAIHHLHAPTDDSMPDAAHDAKRKVEHDSKHGAASSATRDTTRHAMHESTQLSTHEENFNEIHNSTSKSSESSTTLATCESDAMVQLLNSQLPVPVGVIEQSIVQQGPLAILQAMEALAETGVRHMVIDAQSSDELITLIRSTEQLSLLVGSSALGLHLPALFRIRGWLGNED